MPGVGGGNFTEKNDRHCLLMLLRVTTRTKCQPTLTRQFLSRKSPETGGSRQIRRNCRREIKVEQVCGCMPETEALNTPPCKREGTERSSLQVKEIIRNSAQDMPVLAGKVHPAGPMSANGDPCLSAPSILLFPSVQCRTRRQWHRKCWCWPRPFCCRPCIRGRPPGGQNAR